MAEEESRDDKGQRGQAFILVLIALVLGTLLVTPTLGYVATGLVESDISVEQAHEEYAADAAIEYTLWLLQNNIDGITDQLDYENPSLETSITVNGIEVPVDIDITQSPLGESWPFPVPTSQSGIYLDAAIDIKSPFWSPDGETAYFPHVVYMYNCGDSVVHMNSFLQHLDPRFTYVEGSYEGFPAELATTFVDDHWELYFDLDQPLPWLRPGEATFVSFLCSADGEVGDDDTFTSSGSVGYAAFDAEEGEIVFGEYSPSTIGYYYDIETSVGSHTILVNVGITEDGELIILSYTVP